MAGRSHIRQGLQAEHGQWPSGRRYCRPRPPRRPAALHGVRAIHAALAAALAEGLAGLASMAIATSVMTDVGILRQRGMRFKDGGDRRFIAENKNSGPGGAQGKRGAGMARTGQDRRPSHPALFWTARSSVAFRNSKGSRTVKLTHGGEQANILQQQ